jgi:hypothetical protein
VKRRIALAAVAVALVALAVVTAFAWSRQARLVRVGGMGNACTCTQRIEP